MWLISLSLFVSIITFSGWLASRFIYGSGLGLIRNTGIGLFGVIVSYLALGVFQIQVESFPGILAASTIGATVTLAVLKKIRGTSAEA